jgi:hypothetical protein
MPQTQSRAGFDETCEMQAVESSFSSLPGNADAASLVWGTETIDNFSVELIGGALCE